MKIKNKRITLQKIVRIEVRGGVAYLISKPKGVHVLIVDHDAQGGCEIDSSHYHESIIIRNGGRVS